MGTMKKGNKLVVLTGFLFLISVLSGQHSVAQCLVPSGLSTSSITNTGATLKWATTAADSFLVRYYESGTSNFLYKTVKPGTSTSTSITGLYPSTTYYWQVRTWCNGGTSGAYQTTPAVFTTTSTPVSCVVPNKTVTSSVTANSALVSWNTLVNADSFMVRYAVRNTSNYVWLKVPGSQKSLTITGLLSNTSYDWWVRCICASNPSQGYSVLNTFTTLSSTCGTPDVTYFSASNKTSNSATVGWRAVTGAVSYNVRYAVRYSGVWTTVSATTISAPLSGLLPLTWYEFQVQAVCASGTGSWSASGIFQTLSGTLSLARKPYLQLSTTNSIYIRWRTNILSDSRVRYGTSATNLNLSVSNTTPKTEHIVQVTGLTPGTKYFYSVGNATTTLAGDTGHYFFTNPTIGSTKSVRIWTIGDFGRGTTAQKQVRDAYRNYTGSTHTDLWLWLGDNAYNDGTDPEYQTKVFDIYPHQFNKWVVWPTSGNHDLHTANSTNQTGPYYDNFTMPKNGEAGGIPSGTEAYYSYNYANIHFVCLESYTSSMRSSTGAMANWLRSDLAANTQRWTIVYFHHPPYSKGSHDSDTETELMQMRANIIPILESYKVDLVLSGHSHAYERSLMIRGHYGLENTFNASTMAISTGSGIYPNSYLKNSPNYYGTVYVVCGVAGTVGGTMPGYPHNCMYTSTVGYYGSLVIDVNGDRLDSKFLTSTGQIWDQFTIQKSTGNQSWMPNIQSRDNEAMNLAVPISNELLVFPNPITDDASISYNLEKASTVRIEVMDLAGRVVYQLGDEMEQMEGPHVIRFPSKDANLPKGTYLIRMISDHGQRTSRIVID